MKKILVITILLYAKISFATIGNLHNKTFKTSKWLTNNGVRVVFYKTNNLPMLDTIIAFPAGSAFDNKLYGISTLTSQILNQSQPTRNLALESIGAKYSASSNRDMAIFHLRTTTNAIQQEKAIQIFADLLSDPQFTETALNRTKEQIIAAIKNSHNTPNNIAIDNLYETIYKNDPYGHNPLGNIKSLKTITLEDMKDFYKQNYTANNKVILVIVGKINKNNAYRISNIITNKLNLATNTQNPSQKPLSDLGVTKEIKFPHSPQSTVHMGQLAIKYNDPDYFPLLVGNYILGGAGLNSRLALAIREKQGMTYDISSTFILLEKQGIFDIGFATEKKNLPTVLTQVKKIIYNFIQEGPTQNELNEAKLFLIGNLPISLDSNLALAKIFLTINFYNLNDDFLLKYEQNIKSVTSQDITKAFKKIMNINKMSTIIVG